MKDTREWHPNIHKNITNLNHMMCMTNLVAIDFETPMIDNRNYLQKEDSFDLYESLNGLILNFQ